MGTDTVKNEHIVYAYGYLQQGGSLLLIGITDIGWEYLKKEPGNFLNINNFPLSNPCNIWVVRGKDKEEIKKMMRIALPQVQELSERH